MEYSAPAGNERPRAGDWTKANQWRRVGIWIVTFTTLVVAISLATMPIINYTFSSDFRNAWIWGWSDSGFSYWKWFWEIPPANSYMDYSGEYSVCTDFFYPAAIAAMIFGAINFLIYLGEFLYIRGKPRQDSVGVIRIVTVWTWIWAIWIMIESAAANVTRTQPLLGNPNINAWITFGAAFALSGACWLVKPFEEERAELQARISWLKGEISNFFARSGFPSTVSEVNHLINRSYEIGEKKLRREVQTYAGFLPKLWAIFQAYAKKEPANLSVLRAQLGMEEMDSSKIILELARRFKLTIEGDMLVSRPDLDVDELMKFSERLLNNWEAEVRRREAARA